MLTKRSKTLSSKPQAVKKSALAAMLVTTMTAMGYAPASFASGPYVVEKTVTVKFAKSELSQKDGVEAVYSKFEEKAKRFCKSEGYSLSYFEETLEDCISDLVNQFVDSADIDVMSAYHKAQSAVQEAKLQTKSES